MTKYGFSLVAVGLAGACSAALAAQYGTVISSTPVMAQVTVPQQQCFDQPVQWQPATSGGGALLGALVGGALGNNLGAGMGRAAATGLGVVAGAAIGDRTEAANTPPVAAVARNCTNTSRLEIRLVGYDVVYEYNGQRYTARLPQDPGPRIALDVTVAPPYAAPAPAYAAPPVVYAAPPAVYAAPAVVYAGPALYGAVGGYYGPSVVVSPRLVFGGYGRRGDWH